MLGVFSQNTLVVSQGMNDPTRMRPLGVHSLWQPLRANVHHKSPPHQCFDTEVGHLPRDRFVTRMFMKSLVLAELALSLPLCGLLLRFEAEKRRNQNVDEKKDDDEDAEALGNPELLEIVRKPLRKHGQVSLFHSNVIELNSIS